MKVKLTLLLAALSIMAFSAMAFAAQFTQTAPGEAVLTTNTSAPGGVMSFSPSPSVVMGGNATPQAFAVSAYHNAAVNKTDGKAFGMAMDATDVFWWNIGPDGDSTAASAIVTGTNSATFTSWSTF